GEAARGGGEGCETQAARRAGDILRDARGIVPLLLVAGVGEIAAEILRRAHISVQNLQQRLEAQRFFQRGESRPIDSGGRVRRGGILPRVPAAAETSGQE